MEFFSYMNLYVILSAAGYLFCGLVFSMCVCVRVHVIALYAYSFIIPHHFLIVWSLPDILHAFVFVFGYLLCRLVFCLCMCVCVYVPLLLGVLPRVSSFVFLLWCFAFVYVFKQCVLVYIFGLCLWWESLTSRNFYAAIVTNPSTCVSILCIRPASFCVSILCLSGSVQESSK